MNDQSQSQPVPDVLLPRDSVGQILLALNNAVIFVKAQDGSMRPFVDPIPIQQILQQAITNALKGVQQPPGD
jgi:hypothetical protein